MILFPQVNLRDDRAASCLGGEIQHVGQRVDICYKVEAAKVTAGMPADIRLLRLFFTMCSGLDHGKVDRWIMLSS